MNADDFHLFLDTISTVPLTVLDAGIPRSAYTAVDLSHSNAELQHVDVSVSANLEAYINSYLQNAKALVGYGGYNEQRNIYQRSATFNQDDSATERNIHIGMDLWIAADSTIYAPLAGVVHSFKTNANYGDYGPTIILRHEIDDVTFYTLYGHLSSASIKNLAIGQRFEQGEGFAALGDATVNGDYPPHLHFQIIKDLQGFVGDYPGVCNAKDLNFYLRNCPDPNLLLKLGKSRGDLEFAIFDDFWP